MECEAPKRTPAQELAPAHDVLGRQRDQLQVDAAVRGEGWIAMSKTRVYRRLVTLALEYSDT